LGDYGQDLRHTKVSDGLRGFQHELAAYRGRDHRPQPLAAAHLWLPAAVRGAQQHEHLRPPRRLGRSRRRAPTPVP